MNHRNSQIRTSSFKSLSTSSTFAHQTKSLSKPQLHQSHSHSLVEEASSIFAQNKLNDLTSLETLFKKQALIQQSYTQWLEKMKTRISSFFTQAQHHFMLYLKQLQAQMNSDVQRFYVRFLEDMTRIKQASRQFFKAKHHAAPQERNWNTERQLINKNEYYGCTFDYQLQNNEKISIKQICKGYNQNQQAFEAISRKAKEQLTFKERQQSKKEQVDSRLKVIMQVICQSVEQMLRHPLKS